MVCVLTVFECFCGQSHFLLENVWNLKVLFQGSDFWIWCLLPDNIFDLLLLPSWLFWSENCKNLDERKMLLLTSNRERIFFKLMFVSPKVRMKLKCIFLVCPRKCYTYHLFISTHWLGEKWRNYWILWLVCLFDLRNIKKLFPWRREIYTLILIKHMPLKCKNNVVYISTSFFTFQT